MIYKFYPLRDLLLEKNNRKYIYLRFGPCKDPDDVYKYDIFLILNDTKQILKSKFKDCLYVEFPIDELLLEKENNISIEVNSKSDRKIFTHNKVVDKSGNDLKEIPYSLIDLKFFSSKYINFIFNPKVNGKLKVNSEKENFTIAYNSKVSKIFNVPLENISSIELSSEHYLSFCVSNEINFTSEQARFMMQKEVISKNIDGINIYYKLKKVQNPKKILFTFPGVNTTNNAFYKMSLLTSQEKILQDVTVVSFLDVNYVYGNYLTVTEKNQRYNILIKKIVDSWIKDSNLTENDVIFYGNSKGGSIALDYIDLYKNSYFFVDIPQLDVTKYVPNPLQGFILKYHIPYIIDYRKKLMNLKNRKVFYTFAENDFTSNCGLGISDFTGINVSMLKNQVHTGAAARILPLTMYQINNIITRGEVVPQIEAVQHINKNFDVEFICNDLKDTN